MKNYKQLVRDAFSSIFENPVYDPQAIDHYFSTTYVQHVDGKTLDFHAFRQHIKTLKDHMSSIVVDFQTLAQENDVVFSNHIVDGTTKEGRKGQVRVIAEFRFSDDKIVFCSELTHMIEGDEKDRDLGSRL